GVAGVDYPPQMLAASGGVSPYLYAIGSGSLPSGMTAANGNISGTPALPGDFPFTVTVTDSSSPPVTITSSLALNVRPAAPGLIVGSSNLSFSLATGATSPPAAQSVSIQSAVASQTINYTAAISPASSWLSVAG